MSKNVSEAVRKLIKRYVETGTNRELAAELLSKGYEVSEATISLWKSGKRCPGPESLAALAEVFGFSSVEQMIEGHEYPEFDKYSTATLAKVVISRLTKPLTVEDVPRQLQDEIFRRRVEKVMKG